MWILVVLSLLVAVVACVGAVIALRRTQNVPTVVREELPEDVQGLRQEVAALQAEARQSLRHLALVRYDAFGDMGGQLSWSVALLDDSGSGVVITSISGRSESRTYAKTVTDWKCEQQLSPEEADAISRARP